MKDFSDIKNFGLVSIQRIADIKEHPKNENLEIVRVLNQECVVRKKALKIGDYIAFSQNGTLLSERMAPSFPHLEKGRVVKRFIDGIESNGLCIHLGTVLKNLPPKTKNEDRVFSFEIGDDISDLIGAVKK